MDGTISVDQQYLLKSVLKRHLRQRVSVRVRLGKPVVVEKREPNRAISIKPLALPRFRYYSVLQDLQNVGENIGV